MSEHKDKDKDKEKDKDKNKDNEKDKHREIDRGTHNSNSSSSSFSTLAAIASHLSSPTTTDNPTVFAITNNNNNNNGNNSEKDEQIVRKNTMISAISDEFLLKPPIALHYKTSLTSLDSEVFSFNLATGDLEILRQLSKEDTSSATVGTQRVYKKTSPNAILTMYLPTREIVSCGTQPSTLKGILFVDPKAIQGYRVYAQLTLTFRYGREDEEVMGLRFCNEAIMSLYQIYPRTEDPKRELLTPLQDTLIQRLGIGAFPFTLNLSPQSPPSVQLVPAKRYYGAPIGTSYDVRCFIADKTDDKFHRKATVKMGVRVIHKTDVFSTQTLSENFTALLNNPLSPPPPISPNIPKITETNMSYNTSSITSMESNQQPNSLLATEKSNNSTTIKATGGMTTLTTTSLQHCGATTATTSTSGSNLSGNCSTVDNNQQQKQLQQLVIQPQATLQSTTLKSKKQDRGDSFPKIRLSPKSFRFSGRFGRSKSEVERGTNDPFSNYSKSFHEVLDFSKPESCGPQGAVDKPFLLQEGRVCLRASLNKSWYTHGENVIITVNIKNESKKTVRKIRVCAIQHVDVCMFNNGKFKNVVADSDNCNLPSDQTIVGPGKTLNSQIILKPKRGPTKNWIALEDSLQRCSEPDEIIGDIAASAVRIPTLNPIGLSPSASEDRNVFAIYVSYYVKIKLTLSGMGGELSLKLPFSLVHIDSSLSSSSTSISTSDSYKIKSNETNNKTKQILADKPNQIIKANSTGTTATTNLSAGGKKITSAKDKSSIFSRQAKGHASDDDIIDIEEDYNIDSIRPDNRNDRKCCEYKHITGGCSSGDCSNCNPSSGSTCIEHINSCNKNLHSLERIDSIEDEIPIQIPTNKNLTKRRLTRSDIRVKDSSQEDNEDYDDDDDDDNMNKTTIITTITDALVHTTMHQKISTSTTDEIVVVHHQQHSSSSSTALNSCENEISTYQYVDGTDNRHDVDNDDDNSNGKKNSFKKINEKENFNRHNISAGCNNGGKKLINQCDIKKSIQSNDDNNVMEKNNDKSVVSGHYHQHSPIPTSLSSMTVTAMEATATTTANNITNNSNDNTTNNQQHHHLQTTCAEIHTPHDP